MKHKETMKDYSTDNGKAPAIARESLSSWGGSWTEQKLDAFEKYVKAYLTIMNNIVASSDGN